MSPLMQILRACDEQHIALGHFNVSDLVMLRAVVDAAETVGVPVISRHRWRPRCRTSSVSRHSCRRTANSASANVGVVLA